MPDRLYADSMLLTDALARVAALQPLLEAPDQQALDVLRGRIAELEHENRTLRQRIEAGAMK